MTPNIRKILVPTDFSPRSDAALEYAAALATALNAAVHLVHVVEEPFAGEWEMYVRAAQEIRDQLDADARSRLATAVGRLDPEQCPSARNPTRLGLRRNPLRGEGDRSRSDCHGHARP